MIRLKNMDNRSIFLKSELQKIYNNLNMSYEYVDFLDWKMILNL